MHCGLAFSDEEDDYDFSDMEEGEEDIDSENTEFHGLDSDYDSEMNTDEDRNFEFWIGRDSLFDYEAAQDDESENDDDDDEDEDEDEEEDTGEFDAFLDTRPES